MQIYFKIENLSNDTPLPQLYQVHQRPSTPKLDDVAGAIRSQLDAAQLNIQPGMQIAVTAGSRGIRDIALSVKTMVAWLRDQGADPFVVPAMGSHGGATAEGQISVLADLGVTESYVECPIRSSMEVVELGSLDDNTPVFMDRIAYEADGVLLVNRVKPHTDFHSQIESGLAKVCAVGLGKRRGAEIVHSRGPEGLRTRMPLMARMVIEHGKVLGGIALLENAEDYTAEVHFLQPEEIGREREAELVVRAKELIGRLPFDQIDALIVDELGKNISGCGMDTNVIGRLRIPGEADPISPRVNVIAALDLTPASHGNAAGVGLADFVPARMVEKIDWEATYINSITSGLGGIQRAALPIVLPTVRDTIATALRTCAQPDLERIRLVRVHNTLHLSEFYISAALLDEVRANPNLELIGPADWTNIDG